jgi:hypothetical protein
VPISLQKPFISSCYGDSPGMENTLSGKARNKVITVNVAFRSLPKMVREMIDAGVTEEHLNSFLRGKSYSEALTLPARR